MWTAPHSRTETGESSSQVVPSVVTAGVSALLGLPVRHALALILSLGWWLNCASAAAAEFIHFSPPPFLDGPSVSRAALGATYLYRGRDQFAGTEVRITVARQPPEMASPAPPSASTCLEIFEAELKRQHPDLFALPSALQLRVGPEAFSQIRWSRRHHGTVMTGVLACAVHRNHFVAINYGATSALALKLFPAIRQQLNRLTLNF